MACVVHGSQVVAQDVDIDTRILAKKAMNAPKDRQVVIEPAAIRERMNKPKKE